MPGHTRPNGTKWSTANPLGGSRSEGLAWHYDKDSDLITGIDQFYDEKYDWVNQTGGVTGHYESLINPKYTYVGLIRDSFFPDTHHILKSP